MLEVGQGISLQRMCRGAIELSNSSNGGSPCLLDACPFKMIIFGISDFSFFSSQEEVSLP